MLRLQVPDKRWSIQMTPVHSLIFRRPANQERAFFAAGHLDRQVVCTCRSKDKSDGQDRSAGTFAIDCLEPIHFYIIIIVITNNRKVEKVQT